MHPHGHASAATHLCTKRVPESCRRSAAVRIYTQYTMLTCVPISPLSRAQLAPGGHLGRFCIWTQAAFERLDAIFGTQTTASAVKKGFKVPRAPMTNGDLARLINSDEIQSVVRKPKVDGAKHAPLKKNPLRNLGAMVKLNPYAKVAKRIEITKSAKKAAARAAKLAKIAKGEKTGGKKAAAVKAIGKKFHKSMIVDSDYVGEDYDLFNKWINVQKPKSS